MTTPTYTAAELRQFDRLTMQACSRHQVERIEGRLALNRFITEHGKEKCDAMFAKLTKAGQ